MGTVRREGYQGRDETAHWDSDDPASDSATLSLRRGMLQGGRTAVGLWAGCELDPAYLTPAAARQMADELPALLREFADRAEAADSVNRGA